MDSNERFAMAMEAAYPHFKQKRAIAPIKQPISVISDQETVVPAVVHRDYIHIKTPTWQANSDEIIDAVSQASWLSVSELKSNRRHLQVCRWRHICMVLLRKHTLLSLPAIGKKLNRDHSSVLHGIRKIKANPANFADDISKVESILNATT